MIRLACPICEEPGPWASAQERMAHIRAHHTVDCEVCGATVNASGLDAHTRYICPGPPAAAEEQTPAPPASDDAPAPEPEQVDDNAPDVDDVVQPAAEDQVTERPRVEEPDDPAGLSCDRCDAGPFADRRGLVAHRRSHETVTCEVCSKPVKANGLGPHMAAHRRAAAERAPAEQPDAAPTVDMGEPAVSAPTPDQDVDPAPAADAPEPAASPPAVEAVPPEPSGGPVCEVEGCDRPAAKSTTMCSGHRGRWYRLGDVQADVPLRTRRSYPAPATPAPAETTRSAPQPSTDPPPPRIDRNARVACPDCDEMVRPHGLGSHRASHRRAAAQAAALPPAGRPLGEVLAELLPGAADELVDRLASFVEKHEPDAGHGRWVVATAEGGPWLCRTAGISLLVARENVPCIVVALDDLYAHTGRPADTGLDAGRSWPPHRKAAAS